MYDKYNVNVVIHTRKKGGGKKHPDLQKVMAVVIDAATQAELTFQHLLKKEPSYDCLPKTEREQILKVPRYFQRLSVIARTTAQNMQPQKEDPKKEDNETLPPPKYVNEIIKDNEAGIAYVATKKAKNSQELKWTVLKQFYELITTWDKPRYGGKQHTYIYKFSPGVYQVRGSIPVDFVPNDNPLSGYYGKDVLSRTLRLGAKCAITYVGDVNTPLSSNKMFLAKDTFILKITTVSTNELSETFIAINGKLMSHIVVHAIWDEDYVEFHYDFKNAAIGKRFEIKNITKALMKKDYDFSKYIPVK